MVTKVHYLEPQRIGTKWVTKRADRTDNDGQVGFGKTGTVGPSEGGQKDDQRWEYVEQKVKLRAI